MRLSNIALAITAIYGAFSPADLFANGEQGAWYDPTDVNINWRRNLLEYTEEFDQGVWIKDGVGTVVTPDQALAPNGTMTADLFTFDPGSSRRVRQSVAVVSGQKNTFSVYVRSVTGTQQVRLFTGSVAASSGGSATFTVNDQWQRISVSPVWSASGNAQFRIDSNDLGGSFYVWGAQVEVGSFPTSYIPTEGSAATRAVDVVEISGNKFAKTNLIPY
ncbi:MAG: phage head spike fiber domain-containing protein, partial [Alphaproteobacteria bacterium]